MNKDIPIFITGGTGFIGSYLIRELLSQGYRNISAIRRSTSHRAMVASFEDQVRWIEGDILDVSLLSDCLINVDWVFHAAALVSMDPRDYNKMLKTNIEGTANMVNCSMAAGVDKFLHISSIAALGKPEAGKKWVGEANVWEKSSQTDGYAISKYKAEKEVWRAMAEGLKAVVVNPSIVLGSGIWKKGSANIFYRIYRGLKFYPTGSSGFVDVRDVARFSVQFMQHKVHGERFILNGENRTFLDLLNTVAQNFKRKGPNIAINPFTGFIAVSKEWLFSRLTGTRQQATWSTLKSIQRDVEYCNRKSREYLNADYTSINRTISETVKQFQQLVHEGLPPAMLPPL